MENTNNLDFEPACSCCASCATSANDATSSKSKQEIKAQQQKERRREAILLAACGIPTIIAAAIHIFASDNAALATVATVLALLGSLVGLYIIAPKVRAAVLSKSVDINILMVIAVIGAWILGEHVEAAAVVFFFSVGEWLEGYAIARNRSSIEKLMDLTPQTVHLLQDGNISDVAVESAPLGSVLVVRPGERIALDGIVKSGSASVNESPITGESVPVLKQTGDILYAGSLSVDGRLEFATTATVENSTLARIVALVEESQNKRTPYERFINRFARYYTPLVVVIALLVALIPTSLNALAIAQLGGIEVWGYRALSLLVIACPCALVIATPVSVVAGLTRAARSGVLVKAGAFLELGAKVKAIAFDKTGTLTYGHPEVVTVELLPAAELPKDLAVEFDASPSGILRLAAIIEQDSTHPLARAIIKAAAADDGDNNELAVRAAGTTTAAEIRQAQQEQPVQADAATHMPSAGAIRADSITEVAGKGISGSILGQHVAIGSINYSAELAPLTSAATEAIAKFSDSEASTLVLYVNRRAIAIIAIKDVVRQETPVLIRSLGDKLGIHTAMLTGDNAKTAAAIAKEAGIEQVYAELLPNEKMDRIAELKAQHGTVAMVGDGINDAPALALADVGIAMGAASSDTAIQVADVALLANNIEELPAFFRLAKRVVRTIHTNIIFALAIKFAVMVLAILGIATMWMAIFADVGVLIIVLLYSLRLSLSLRQLRQRIITESI